jgi:hypothetical protein
MTSEAKEQTSEAKEQNKMNIICINICQKTASLYMRETSLKDNLEE